MAKANRAEYKTMKGDTTPRFNIGLSDIDESIVFYFNNVIQPSVQQNGNRVSVPVLYGNPERWKAVQKDGFYRDKNGKIQTPLIMFKRDSIEKNRSLGNKLDANRPQNIQIFEKKFSIKNVYDKFSILNNRIPVKEYHGIITPDYVNITYSCIIFTDFIEQMNKIVESMIFASDSYWGDPNRFNFRAMIDSYNTVVELNQGDDRKVKTEFNITLLGHIIPNTINAEAKSVPRFFSKSSVSFNLETAGSLEELQARLIRATTKGFSLLDDKAKVTNTNTFVNIGSKVAELVQTDPQTTWTFTHNLNFRYPVITVYDVDDRLVIPITTQVVDENTLILIFPFAFTGKATAVGKADIDGTSLLSQQEKNFLTVNTVLDSNLDPFVLDEATRTVTFLNVAIVVPPPGYAPLTISDFLIFINGMNIELSAINSITQSGNNLVLSFNETLDYFITPEKEIVVAGKLTKL